MALSSVELGTRNVSVTVSLVTPGAVAPPLSPVNAGVQLGEWPVHVNWRTLGPHLTPVLARPLAAAGVVPGVAGPPPVAVFAVPVAARPADPVFEAAAAVLVAPPTPAGPPPVSVPAGAAWSPGPALVL